MLNDTESCRVENRLMFESVSVLAMVSRGTGFRARYFSIPPAKSPMSSSAWSGRRYSARTAASLVAPVAAATWPSS